MKKIENYQDAMSVFKKFLEDKKIISKAKTLFSKPSYDELKKAVKEIKNANLTVDDLFIGTPKKLMLMAKIAKDNENDIKVLIKKLKPYLKDKKKIVPDELKPYYDIMVFFDKSYACFSSKDNDYAYEFTKKLGIEACPYCNLEYVDTIMDGSKKILRPDFDHFYCRKSYPFFSISFYNLIPSCKICNSPLKGAGSINSEINPYIYDFHKDAKFTITLLNDDNSHYDGLLSNASSYELELVGREKNSKLYLEQKELFYITERYKSRKAEISEFISRYNKNTDFLVEEVKNTLSGIESVLIDKVFSDDVSIGNIHSRPYTKIKLDLVEVLSKDLSKLLKRQ